jgi:hypothetical protein
MSLPETITSAASLSYTSTFPKHRHNSRTLTRTSIGVIILKAVSFMLWDNMFGLLVKNGHDMDRRRQEEIIFTEQNPPLQNVNFVVRKIVQPHTALWFAYAVTTNVSNVILRTLW